MAAKRKRVYVFKAAGLLDLNTCVEEGQRVVKTQPYGCPKNGVMGQCYVADAETGKFLQMVNEASLVKTDELVSV